MRCPRREARRRGHRADRDQLSRGMRREPAHERSGVRAGARWPVDNARDGDPAAGNHPGVVAAADPAAAGRSSGRLFGVRTGSGAGINTPEQDPAVHHPAHPWIEAKAHQVPSANRLWSWFAHVSIKCASDQQSGASVRNRSGGVRHRRRLGALELRRGGTSDAGALGVLVGVCTLVVGALLYFWPLAFMFTFHPAYGWVYAPPLCIASVGQTQNVACRALLYLARQAELRHENQRQ